jgi:NAD(P)-dependent dehydrogenase (short-subunit alcohol dehydrogenase family)
MSRELAGKVAIVTGAGGGIGRGHAIALAHEGAKVIVNDLGMERGGLNQSKDFKGPAEAVVAEIRAAGGQAVSNFDTVATLDGAKAIIDSAIAAFGRLDILVNNAGVHRPPDESTQIYNLTLEEWNRQIAVNLFGNFACAKYACQLFKEQRSGRIINNSSAALYGSKGQAAYAAAKSGVLGLTRTIARDMEEFGVTCNALIPTGATRINTGPEMEEQWVKQGRGDWFRRMGAMKAEDVSSIVVYLATDHARDINGFVFRATGGQISLYREPDFSKSIFKDGRWSTEELISIIPQTLALGLPKHRDSVNPFAIR